MKNNKGEKIPSDVFRETPSAASIVSDIKDLTVEDIIVIYAYAEAIVETVREPLIILDKDLRVKTANKSFFDTFKVNKKETYNNTIFKLGNGQWDIPDLRKLLLEILPKNSFFNDFEVCHTFDDIGERIMILNARRIELEDQKTQLILLAIEDVTDKKRIERQKDDFIGIATHELKTPLTSIKTLVEVLQKHQLSSEDIKSSSLLSKIDTQINRLNHMMGSFLNVYTIQAGKLELHKNSFSLNALIDEVIETFEHVSETHTVIRKGAVEKNITADRERIEQVLINLISNAIKYSPHSKKVVIKVATKKDTVHICIQDFGIGIAKDKQDKVFERFFRIESKKEKSVEGLGLGLFLSSEIIRQHGGTIAIKSIPTKGSTFIITLPFKQPVQKVLKSPIKKLSKKVLV